MNLLVLGLSLLVAFAPDLNDGTALARQIAGEYAGVTHGIVSFLVSTQTDLRGGPVHRQDVSETVYVGESGVALRKRVLKEVRNGKTLGSADLAKLSQAEDGPLSRFGMRAPWISTNVSDYTFAKPREIGDLILVDFTSTVRDSAHGDGTLAYTRAGSRIDHVLYTPAVLPNDGGAVVLLTAKLDITFGAVGAERWDIVKIVRTYSGRDGMMRGRGTATSLYARYRVHSTQAEAIAALEGESG